jgi:hypothetical protein
MIPLSTTKLGVQLQLLTFEYEDHQPFRTLDRDGEPWFVVADICKALDLSNPTAAVRGIEEDDLTTSKVIDSLGRSQNALVTNESGLYQLIFQSRKEGAKKFKRWITKEVLPSIRKSGSYGSGRLPAFVSRFNANWDRVEAGHFSVISELFVRVHGKLEQVGYRMPDKTAAGVELRPDVSVGQLFPKWLAHHPDYLSIMTRRKPYPHVLPDGKEVDAWQYPNDVLPLFIEYIESEWMPNRSFDYFRSRDQNALEYIPLALPAPKQPKKENRRRSA